MRPLKVAAGVLAFAVSASRLLSQSVTYEGYGHAARGGAGGDTYHVTTLADGGPGSLRDGVFNRTGPRTVVFDVGGTITITNWYKVNSPYLTIDGSTAPAPGITLTKVVDTNIFVIAGTHDIILRHLRFLGLYLRGADSGGNDSPFIALDGDWDPDYYLHDVVIDHVTVLNATDAGMDIWGEVSDVTVSWCLIANSFHPSTLSFIPDPGEPFQKRRRISMHHNVWARNDERNPQLRADDADIDYVNNVIYAWGYWTGRGYGVRIRNEPGEPQVHANIINNYFQTYDGDPTAGLVYGNNPGQDSTDGGPLTPVPQGTVITNSAMGTLWVAGNILPSGNLDQYSTIPAPHPVPTNAQVTTYSAYELRDQVVPNAGMKYRTAEEQALFSEMTFTLQGPTRIRVSNVTPSNCVLELQAAAGFFNDLQFSENLAPANWISLTNFAGTGNLISITNALIDIGTRFYRVVSTNLP
jgi:pectate lyase